MSSLRSTLRVEELDGRALPQVIPVSAAVDSSVFTDVVNQLSTQTGSDLGSINLNSEPSGRGLVSSGHGVFFTNPTLQASFQTLSADVQALRDAIANAYLTNPAVQAAQAQILSLKARWQATRAVDNLVIQAATSDAARQAAIEMKAADREEAQAGIRAAKTILQLTINNDPGVLAAKAKLLGDFAPIAADPILPVQVIPTLFNNDLGQVVFAPIGPYLNPNTGQPGEFA